MAKNGYSQDIHLAMIYHVHPLIQVSTTDDVCVSETHLSFEVSPVLISCHEHSTLRSVGRDKMLTSSHNKLASASMKMSSHWAKKGIFKISDL